jgi:hypothetical protein
MQLMKKNDTLEVWMFKQNNITLIAMLVEFCKLMHTIFVAHQTIALVYMFP